MKITDKQIIESYSQAKKVYQGNQKRSAAIQSLMKEHGLKGSSAADYLDNFKHMLEGNKFSRTMNLFGAKYYITNIKKDYGLEAFRNAISALEKHLDYYESLGSGKQPKMRRLVASFKQDNAEPEKNIPAQHKNSDHYWVFVCNPQKWDISKFLDTGVLHDKWGVRDYYSQYFAPGQLGMIRVGVDRRSKKERGGQPKLEPGIYALCEIESGIFDGTGAGDRFWAPGKQHKAGHPTVKIHYLKTFKNNPLTITAIRKKYPDMDKKILENFQGSCFPISAKDYHRVLALLNESLETLPIAVKTLDAQPDGLSDLEKKFLNAAPETKEYLSKRIERGAIGAKVKKALGHKCQLCSALGRNPISFIKKNGEPYAEAHHVMPVHKREIGSLAASNIMVLCPNHHREIHFGSIDVSIGKDEFDLTVSGKAIKLKKFKF